MEIAFHRLKLGTHRLVVSGPLHIIDLIALQVKELAATAPYVRTHRPLRTRQINPLCVAYGERPYLHRDCEKRYESTGR